MEGKSASFSDLPPEIICIIGGMLYLEDVPCCRLVSHAWLERWDHDVVMSALYHQHFSSKTGATVTQGPDAAQSPARETFLRESAKYISRCTCTPTQQAFLFWNPRPSTTLFQDSQVPSKSPPRIPDHCQYYSSKFKRPSLLYGHGKVAWMPDSSCVIVDDIRTGHRLVCPTRHFATANSSIRLSSLSQNLLVLYLRERRPNGLNHRHISKVWHLRLQIWVKVSLPAELDDCYADGENIAFVAEFGRSVRLWTWGGDTRELDIRNSFSRPTEVSTSSEVPKVFWHPGRPDVVFVSQVYHRPYASAAHGQPLPELVIAKYEHGVAVDRFVKLLRMEYTDPVTGALKQREWTEVRPQCKIMNNDGLFLLAYMTSKTAEYTAEDSYTRVANVSTGTIAFQTTTERFVERIYVDEYGSAAPRFRTHGSIGRDVWTTSWNVLAWDKHIFKATSRENGLIMCLQTEPRYQGRPITRSGVDITAVQEAINASVGHEQPCVHGDGDMLLFVSNRGILLWTFGVRLRTAWRSG